VGALAEFGRQRTDVATQSSPAQPAVSLRNIRKQFGSVVAVNGASLKVGRGEIHGLLGENGAGKTTLMNVLAGVFPPDGGEVSLHGSLVAFGDPRDARKKGIVMARQHFSLVSSLTVWENIALIHSSSLSKRKVVAEVERIGDHYGLSIDPFATVDDLSVGQRQRVEVVKCLSITPAILILDEPTAVLTSQESRELFSTIRRVVDEKQLAVILITHKLNEVLEITDHVSVMREGRVVATTPTATTSVENLVHLMVGRDVALDPEMAAVGLSAQKMRSRDHSIMSDTPPALALKAITIRDPSGRVLLDNFSLTVRCGEIVGIAAAEDSGQQAVATLLSGLCDLASGTVEIDGQQVAVNPSELLDARVSVIPEDRHASGSILAMSVAENLTATELDHFRRGIFINRRGLRSRARDLIDEFDITAASERAPLSSLSGGNQQRVVIARELSREPRVVVAEEPSRGLDVGAIETMYERLQRVASLGAGVVLIVGDLNELLAIADRIVVVFNGRLFGDFARDEIDLQKLSALVGGHHDG